MSHHYLATLESAKSFEKLDAIVDGAFKSLQVIEPWREASTDNPQLQQFIEQIQGHSTVYLEAIDTSIKTAQDGYSFSCDVIELCTQLLNPDTNQADLQKYIEDMKTKAKQAHEDSTEAMNKFRDVRRGLIEITTKLPRKAMGTPKGPKGVVARLQFWASSEKRDGSIEAAIKEMHLAALNKGELSDNVDKFILWWSEMGISLESEEANSQALRPGNRLRVQQIQNAWKVIQDDYMQYKVKIIRLQDHYCRL